MSAESKYPRGKREFHPYDVITNLDAFKDALEDCNLCLEELNLDATFDELREIVSRFIPQKPDGNWIAGRDGYSCPRCPCCGARIRSGTGSSSFVRDDRCRKCGQLIDWSDIKK